MSPPWVIVGCGYTGAYLARALLGRGVEITVTRRDRAAATELAESLAASAGGGSTRGRPRPAPVVRAAAAELADPASLVGLVAPGAIVCCLAPPGPDPGGELRRLLDAARGAARFVYVSSTSVYAPGGGAWVDESWPVAPATEAGRARALAEAALAEAPVPWIALRAAGIHGPGRKLVDRIRGGTYRVIGDGTGHVSRIHVVDLVSAIVAAGASAARGFVNAADDDPAPIGEVADTLAAQLGLPPPPRVPAASVSPELAGMLTADRRIANRRLKEELGVKLRYPSWRSEI
jgi:nucleoside-diphosphate-sugar epimerase